MPATTIDEVLQQLEGIIGESGRKGERIGYFAALYYKVTAKVKEGISRNMFADGKRMELLDVTFANRYLTALEQWKSGSAPTESWKVAFEATMNGASLVLQHLLLGINAHINLDLGIAAVQTTGTGNIEDIHNDFDSINDIINSLTFEVIHDIDRISPIVSLIGLHSGKAESLLVEFSVSNARDGAWVFAETLSQTSGEAFNRTIAVRDMDIAKLARTIARPRGFLRFTIWVIHLFEWKNVSRIIDLLHNARKVMMKADDVKE
jgi:hypothetical protein